MDSSVKFKPIKIVVIGDGGVGKTSLIKWYNLGYKELIVTFMINSRRSMFLLCLIVIGQKFTLIIGH
jgi:signal recognition particle receptor subunit beta